MNKVDITRHIDVFSRDAFGDRRIDVIGAGATGSRIVVSLAKLGLENIHVWDFDKVEAHNIANQAYGDGDIGKLKVDALHDLVKAQTGLAIHKHAERVDGSQELGDVVFLLTDTMSSRKEIWSKGIRYKMRTKLMIETRMGASEGRVYTVNPTRPAHVKGWEGTLYDDAVAEVSACGTTITVGPTAEFLSGLAVWQLIRWQAIEQGKEDVLDNEILFGLRPLYTMTRQFE
ncbi:MAG TPA: ThiF family adenylyltransferase [Candidatus Obscuribacterales bacterium]